MREISLRRSEFILRVRGGGGLGLKPKPPKTISSRKSAQKENIE